MNNERYCENINSRLAQLVAEVRQSSGSNLHSINIHAESFFRAFLNLLFGWELSNANAVQPNAEGIDLLYPGGNVVVQVSSTTTHQKVQSSLEKSARFPGARFIFVAIDDSLPNYRAPFDPCGLTFDLEKDILDTTRLYDRIVHHEGYGTKQAVDVQRELSDLADKYLSRQERRKELRLRPLGQSKAKSLFEYNADAVPLLGRDSELEALKRFVTGEPEKAFSWWALTGPGAAGKTRLAYELQNRLLREGEWDVAVLSPVVLDRYVREEPDLSDACPGRTLFIVDYVQQHTEALALLVKRLSNPELERSAPLRLLLLDRDIRDEDGRIVWLERIWGTDHHVHDSFYGRSPLPLKLSPISAAGDGGPDPLEVLIRSFADRLCAAEVSEGSVLHPLPAGKEAYLRRRLEEVDPGLLRPLFAMILADAYVRDPETERWSREQLLAQIVDREWDMLAARIAPFHHANSRLLPDSFRILWTTATVLGAGDQPLSMERLRELLPQVWDVLSRASSRHEDELESWTARPEEALLQRAGLLAEGRVQPLRPDLLGEYLVLDALRRAVPAERNAFLNAVLSELVAARIFFGRVLDDYGTLLQKDEELWNTVFPNDPQTELEKLAQYSRLLRRLFEQSREKSVRGKLCRTLTAFAARQHGEEEALAWVFGDTASVLHAIGDYPKALKYYEKDRKISETVLGPEHPSTATTYNNMAGVYHAMGDYLKALEYSDEARKIRETVLGSEHPSTATTYNNMALIYQDMGDYPRALVYYKKARKIFETVLGPGHRSTATAYNNMAGVYHIMGDYLKALEYLDKTRKIVEVVLGSEHPDTAMTYNNTALVYQDMGDYPKALVYYNKARKIWETVLGPEHPNTAAAYNNMASVYQTIGDFPRALVYYEKAQKIREIVLGLEHPSTATTYNSMAGVFHAMGDYPKALEYSDKARKIWETVLGPEHPSTAMTYNNMALVYQDMGDYPRALEYYDKTRKIVETVLGPEHPSTATTYNNMAGVYHIMGDCHKALEYYDKARNIRETVLGPEHPSTATTYHNLAMIHFELHNPEEALRYSDLALAIFRRILGSDHPNTRTVEEFNRYLQGIGS